jgi:anaerobic nitric oxide reductase flavorubredoxin
MIKGLSFKNKKAAAFGSYGWSGESVKIISENLKGSGFELLDDGIRETWNPNIKSMENCIMFGKDISLSISSG